MDPNDSCQARFSNFQQDVVVRGRIETETYSKGYKIEKNGIPLFFRNSCIKANRVTEPIFDGIHTQASADELVPLMIHPIGLEQRRNTQLMDELLESIADEYPLQLDSEKIS